MRWIFATWFVTVSVVGQTTPAQAPATAPTAGAKPNPVPATAPTAGATPTPAPATAPAVGTAALDEQRASILKQVQSIIGKGGPPADSFFSVPWIDPLAPPNVAPAVAACQPMATDDLNKIIEQNASQEGVKADLIRAVIGQESGGKPCAVSVKGAQGLMQLMPATSSQFNVKDPFDPQQNVEAGTKLLKQLLTKYKGDLSLALSAYNAGENRVGPDGQIPANQETADYVKAILAKLQKN